MDIQHTVVIGYSFGISPTSEPGPLNEKIGKAIASHLAGTSPRPFVGVQWELEEVLRHEEADKTRDCVVEPVAFREEDIEDLKRFRESVQFFKPLIQALSEIECQLDVTAKRDHQPDIESMFAFPNRAVSYANRLLHSTTLYQNFHQWLTLPSLAKTKNGRKWTETREIPGTDSGPLKTYQAQRLNRLILETILPVQKADYIATFHVAEAALEKAKDRGLNVQHIDVFGHPAHVGRCRIQTIESAWKIGLRLDPASVTAQSYDHENIEDDDNWDPTNAQEWVHNYDKWEQHEGL